MLYYSKSPDFYTEKVYKELGKIETALQKFDYVIFPYLTDFSHRIPYLKLLYSINKLGHDEIIKEAENIIEYSKGNLYWKSFMNIPEMFSIAVQSSAYVSTYFQGYKDEIPALPSLIFERVEQLKVECRKLIENHQLEEKSIVRYINLSCIYTGLLLLGEKKDLLEATQVLENIMLSYQQIPFHAFIDPIFVNLMQGYLSLQNYEKVDDSYRRYKKSTKGKVVNPENDYIIHAIYYTSKWIGTGRNQYVNKLKKVRAVVVEQNFTNTLKLIDDLISYFKAPIRP